MENNKTTMQLWLVFGHENHPDRERRFCGVFDSEELAKDAAKDLNESSSNQRAPGYGGTLFRYDYYPAELNCHTWESL